MIRIYIVAEGQTEAAFVNNVLAPYFIMRGKKLIPITLLTSRDLQKGIMYKGGVTSYKKLRENVTNVLKQAEKHGDAYVTTMIDFYGFPADFPRWDEIRADQDHARAVTRLEQAFLEDVQKEDAEAPRWFVPYIQLHEFEALLFVDLSKLRDECLEDEDRKRVEGLMKQVKDIPAEEINRGPDTAPSKRILDAVHDYDKKVMGIKITNEIGLETLCRKCPHFGAWVKKMEALGCFSLAMKRDKKSSCNQEDGV